MLKNPTPTLSLSLSVVSAVTILLNLTSRHMSTYMEIWKLAIILSILKSSKDPSVPELYRPVALTSVLGKLFQKYLTKDRYGFSNLTVNSLTATMASRCVEIPYRP